MLLDDALAPIWVPIIGDVPPGQAVPSTAVGTARDLGLNGSRPGSRSGVFPVSLRTVLALGRTVLDGAGLLPRCDLDLAPRDGNGSGSDRVE